MFGGKCYAFQSTITRCLLSHPVAHPMSNRMKPIAIQKKRAKNEVPDPTSTYEKHTPERVSSNVIKFAKKRNV
jgi:hypothetical protein